MTVNRRQRDLAAPCLLCGAGPSGVASGYVLDDRLVWLCRSCEQRVVRENLAQHTQANVEAAHLRGALGAGHA